MVYAHGDAAMPGQTRQQIQFVAADDFVAQMDIAYASSEKRNDLADFLATDANGTPGKLTQRNFGAAMRFRVRPQRKAMTIRQALHRAKVVFEGCKIKHECRRVDIGKRVTWPGDRGYLQSFSLAIPVWIQCAFVHG